MNAIDAAETLLHNAINALDRHAKPTVKDIEDAYSATKKAQEILKASNALLDEGIFTVTDEPAEGTPLPFDKAAGEN